MSNSPAKLSQLIGVRFSPAVSARLDIVCQILGEKSSAFIRRATVKALTEHEAAAPNLTPQQIHLLARIESAQARGVDVDRLLIEALQTQLAVEAAAAPGAPAPAAAA